MQMCLVSHALGTQTFMQNCSPGRLKGAGHDQKFKGVKEHTPMVICVATDRMSADTKLGALYVQLSSSLQSAAPF